jgi:hypothetical protein
MLRNAKVVLAIVLILGSFGLPTSAFAGGGQVGGGDGIRGHHFGGSFGGAPGDGYGGYGSRTSGLGGYGGHDLWGHRGAYYGPIIPPI